ncbi:hypothetical protein BU26DRAFT_522881 [Trematosphaeria pertusa]|uniref:Uncharacterized protein n=1 Tax=Trematosphaeria pertusa TaxID=390896 RepID=A0A6A6I1N5_9PLEO|nr:uncharacterized protein BU26DRAFT_522881 [Trematosphaeria pertusa]KAF2244187.1 hypothetical protein BU26DRAFT_522881 [Trematosphaeria pertusa]
MYPADQTPGRGPRSEEREHGRREPEDNIAQPQRKSTSDIDTTSSPTSPTTERASAASRSNYHHPTTRPESDQPASSRTSASFQGQQRNSWSQPEIRRVSGQFNAPTHIEIERHKDRSKSRMGVKEIRRLGKWIR